MITVPTRRGLAALPNKKTLIVAVILLPSILMWLYQVGPALYSRILKPTDKSTVTSTKPQIDGGDATKSDPVDLSSYLYNPDSNVTVNLVVATIASDNISWTSNLQIPNLNIIRYVSDDATATYHPPVAKGREALMYFTYLHDFYDRLPDVSILIHAEESPWHADPELWSSMTFTLSNLNLAEVDRRGYTNLRIHWFQACPDWINTTKTVAESTKSEEPWMRAAFEANFGTETPVPELLGGPCCSQFAVTRAAVRRRPRDAYARALRWLVETDWSDYIAGRVWEHMWSWLFRFEPSDCPVEWKSFCRLYGVCFEGAGPLEAWRALWEERERLRERQGFWRELWDPQRMARERARIATLDGLIENGLRTAMQRGTDWGVREDVGDMYSEADGPAFLRLT